MTVPATALFATGFPTTSTPAPISTTVQSTSAAAQTPAPDTGSSNKTTVIATTTSIGTFVLALLGFLLKVWVSRRGKG